VRRELRIYLGVGVAILVALSAVGVAGWYLPPACQPLATATTPEPMGWEKAADPAWTVSGAPVLYFVGSVACPYCDASSWPVYLAMLALGNLDSGSNQTSSSGVPTPPFVQSNPGDTPPSIPGIDLAQVNVSSDYVSLVPLVGNVDTTITIPAADSCSEQGYISEYDTGGSIPFIAINGQYFHVGSLVNVTALEGYTPQHIWGQLLNQTQPAWGAISPEMYMIEALLVKVNGGQPTSVATNSNVAALLAQIT
jgi:hypothetical protein